MCVLVHMCMLYVPSECIHVHMPVFVVVCKWACTFSVWMCACVVTNIFTHVQACICICMSTCLHEMSTCLLYLRMNVLVSPCVYMEPLYLCFVVSFLHCTLTERISIPF